MTKSDFLQIILLQRTKLVEEHQKPGWNLWVLTGAFASLLWLLLTLLEKKDFNLRASLYFSISLFILYNILKPIYYSLTSFPSKQKAKFVYIKNLTTNSLPRIVFGLATLIFIYGFISKTSTNNSTIEFVLFNAVSLIILLFFIIFLLASFINIPINLNPNSKSAKKVTSLTKFLFFTLSLSPLFLIYPDLPRSVDYSSIKLGLLIFSLHFIILKLISTSEDNLLLNQIDELIEDVTFDYKNIEDGQSTLKLILFGLQFNMIFSDLINEHIELTKSHEENCILILDRLKELESENDTKQQNLLVDAINGQVTKLETTYALVSKNRNGIIQKLSFYSFSEQDSPEYNNITDLIAKSGEQRAAQLQKVKDQITKVKAGSLTK